MVKTSLGYVERLVSKRKMGKQRGVWRLMSNEKNRRGKGRKKREKKKGSRVECLLKVAVSELNKEIKVKN